MKQLPDIHDPAVPDEVTPISSGALAPFRAATIPKLRRPPRRPSTEGRRLESALADAAVRGDARAFQQLVGRARRRVMAVAMRRTLGNVSAAEEAVQETFVIVWQRLATWERRASFSTWACGFVWRVAAKKWRRDKRYRPLEPSHEREADRAATPELSLTAKECGAVLDAARERLDPLEARLHRLHHDLGEPIESIARITGLTEREVKTILQSAREKIGTLDV